MSLPSKLLLPQACTVPGLVKAVRFREAYFPDSKEKDDSVKLLFSPLLSPRNAEHVALIAAVLD